MKLLKYLGVAMVVGLGLQPSTSHAYGRQYYGGWSSYKSYHYRPYYYKPYPSYAGYKHNYVIYYPSQPTYYYYYSPYSKQYWGRCPADSGGKPVYSFLEPKDRPEASAPTPEPPKADFPPPGKLPKIQQTAEEKKLDPNPPDLDLPPDDKPPTKDGGIPVGKASDVNKDKNEVSKVRAVTTPARKE